MPRPYVFPTPDRVKVGNPTVFIDASLAIALYNQENKANAQRFSQSVREWVRQTAFLLGWSHAGVPGDNSGVLLRATVDVTPHENYPHDTYRRLPSR